jgi:hypothetical protein
MSKEIDPKALVVRSGKRSGAQRVGYSGFPSNPTVRGSAAIIPDYWFSNLPFKPQVGRDLGEGPPIHQEHGEQCGRLGIAHGRARQLVAQLHADRTNCAPLLAYRNAKGYTVRSNRAVERQRHHCRRRARPKRNIARRSPRPTRQSRGSGSWRSVWCSTRPPAHLQLHPNVHIALKHIPGVVAWAPGGEVGLAISAPGGAHSSAAKQHHRPHANRAGRAARRGSRHRSDCAAIGALTKAA